MKDSREVSFYTSAHQEAERPIKNEQLINMVSMKARLQRLLGRQSRFRKSLFSDRSIPETEISSSSSTGTSIADLDDISYYGTMGDPFADVRERMEALSARDKARFADPNIPSVETPHNEESEPCISSLIAYLVYFSYAILIFIGHLRDFCALLFGHGCATGRRKG